jgi:hypothetical protein
MKWFKSLRNATTAPSPGGRHDSSETLGNFTPHAQQALALARKEADRFNHNFVGTEHLLLGIIKLGQGVAVNVLRKLGLDLETVRLEVEKQVGMGPDQKMAGMIPYTPRVKKVLALAQKEAKALNHTYLGTEHILLGLLREGDGVAARVLRNLDVDIEQTRQQILRALDPNFSAASEDTKPSEIPQHSAEATPQLDAVDTSKRYDIYCTEHNREVVYRNACFKGPKRLFQPAQYYIPSGFLDLEQADGQTVCVARASVVKFCEHGVTPSPESASGGGAGG